MTLVAAACAVCGGTSFDVVFPSTISDPEEDPAAYFSSSRRRARPPERHRARCQWSAA